MSTVEGITEEVGEDTNSSRLPHILEDLWSKYPVEILYSIPVNDEEIGYVLTTAGSCRILWVTEPNDFNDINAPQWSVQAFRIRHPYLNEVDFDLMELLCAEMAEDPEPMSVGLVELETLISRLYFGYGTGSELIYLQGYDDEGSFGWSDASRMDFGGEEYEEDGNIKVLDLLSRIPEEVAGAALVEDVVAHMQDLAISMNVGGVDHTVYRTRFSNYPTISAETEDLVLVHLPYVDVLHRMRVAQDIEITGQWLDENKEEDNKTIEGEAIAFVYRGIVTALENGNLKTPTSV